MGRDFRSIQKGIFALGFILSMQVKAEASKVTGYASIDGLKMYYEIEGSGKPLVYVPPAFGFAGMKSFPDLVKNHKLITVDLQGHGRTADLPDRPLSIEQHAKDVVALLKFLKITKADFLGESYGGAVVTMIAVRHPTLVDRVATYGATFGPPQVAIRSELMKFKTPPTAESETFAFQKEKYKEVAPDASYWPKIWAKVVAMKWQGFSREELASIKAPVLIALGDHDFVRLEHAVETAHLIPQAELAVIPDAGHFVLYSEPERVIPIIAHFLEKPERRLPVATPETGYRPGQTR